MIIKKIAIGNINEAFVENRIHNGVNIIFSDDNNKGKTLIMQGMMYALGNQPIFPKGFNYRLNFFYTKIEIKNIEIEVLRKESSFVVKREDQIYVFDSTTELKHFFVDERLMEVPSIIKDGHQVISDLDLFYEMFFVGQDKRNPSNIINSGYNNKKDFINMLCSLNGYQLHDMEDENDNQLKIKQLKADISATKKLLKLIKGNSNISGYVNKYSDNEQFTTYRSLIKSVYSTIGEYKKKRMLELNRKEKLESLIQELNSLNREIKQGNVVCASCGSDKIIYKNRSMAFEVSNQFVRTNVLTSIRYQIEQKEEVIREYTRELQKGQDELKKILQDVPVELHQVLLFSETILSEIDYDDKLIDLNAQLCELQKKDIQLVNNESEAKKQYSKMKQDIVVAMNILYKEVDSLGGTVFDDIFTKKDETYSGSEEQEYYYSRILAINDYFKHQYPLLIDCFRSGEISSIKEDIMLNNYIARKKQVIVTATLKEEEYSAHKYDHYKKDVNIIDYSSNTSSKLLQKSYVPELKDIIESFNVIFDE